MKRWIPLLVAALSSISALHSATVQEVYAQGVRAYSTGNTALAKQLFGRVLAADPENKSAAAYLRTMAANPVPVDLKSKADALMVSKVDFKDASLTAVLDYLPKLATKESGGGMALNVVRAFPKEYGDEKHITLQLSNVPMSSVLEYIAQIGGLTVKYEKVAIVLRPAEGAAPAAPQ